METKFDLTAEGCKTFTPGGSSKAREGEPEFLTFWCSVKYIHKVCSMVGKKKKHSIMKYVQLVS